ncbi:MAG: endonuclease [Bacteroidota bacterium]|nr:endonuclease [Bacteroidota bacterium]
MLINRLTKFRGTLVLLILLSKTAHCQEKRDSTAVRLMFYNVENLFDTSDDSLKDDEEFLPSGLRRWNKTRYDKKISSIYKTITAAGEWSPPAIVAFCEVENRRVLEDLTTGTPLSKFQYGIIHEESPDERGIDVCLIYRKDIVNTITHKSWIPGSLGKEDFHTRSVLYVKGVIFGDTLHLIINHWPSRRGGVLTGETQRMEIARMVRSAADSINRVSGGTAGIVIMGDFNSNPGDPAIQTLVDPSGYTEGSGGGTYVNLSDKRKQTVPGTYRYMGVWEMIDQMIVSEGLIKGGTGLHTTPENFRIFAPDFLLRKDKKYPGQTTFSTYSGYRYQGGFSDHLPILLDLGFRKGITLH